MSPLGPDRAYDLVMMAAPEPPSAAAEPPSAAAERPSKNGARSAVEEARQWRLVVLGYITAITLPPIGIVLGIALATRRGTAQARHGALIIAISVVATVVWFLVFNSGIADTSNNDLQ
jgi:hypothetical protein